MLSFSHKTECATFEADYTPWSGYWWSAIRGTLVTGVGYLGHPAPLEKYDYVTSGTYDGPAIRYGMEHLYNSDAELWEGLCFCWSAASVLEEEPVHKGIYKDTVFYVGDKKGLLTAVYHGTLFNSYSTDTPEDFHRLLEDFIAGQKTPIIMDLGDNGESWNYPVFKYDTDYTQEGNIRHYTTTIYHAMDEVPPDFIGTLIRTVTFYYYFVLDENGNITESGWEKGTTPPVNASEPFGTEPLNPDMSYEQVKEIVNTTDDPFEDNNSSENAVSLSSGSYPMIAGDSDYFKVELKKGNRLTVRVTTDEQGDDTELKTYLRTYTPDGQLIQETTGRGEQVFSANDQEGAYVFEISPSKNAEEPVYHLTVLQSLSYRGIYPVYPSGQWCNGLALLIPDRGDAHRAIISLMDKQGFPQKSYNDNSSLRHLSGTIANTFGLSSPSESEYIRIDADLPFTGLQIGVARDSLMSGANFISMNEASSKIVFPRFETMGWIGGWQTLFGMVNMGDQAEEIVRQTYDENGQFLASDTIELSPGQKVEDESLDILNSDAKTMVASAASGRNCLAGYVQFRNGSGGTAFMPLTRERGNEFTVPHIASDDHWWTNITVMNTGEDDSAVTFSAYDSEGNLIGISEQKLKARQNFISNIKEIFSEILNDGIAAMKIVGDGSPLNGILLYGTRDNFQMAGMPLPSSGGAASSLYLPHIACIDAWWNGIGIMNTGNSSTNISLSAFNKKGHLLDVIRKHLNPNQRLSDTIGNLFGDEVSRSARYVKIKSYEGQPLTGVYLIGSNDGSRLMGDMLVTGDL
ncbi:hypothetical protein [Desulfonema magnum]|uniref:hypothetical protein n=1 Tax=Desulfonema magnum TaxID=45655 RepID=UPI001A9C1879|nr:hypothetical protein [Desulfonema magnum]